MKRTTLQNLVGIFCLAIVTSCNKEVKAPVNKIQAKTSVTSAAGTQTSNQAQNTHTCGGGNSQSGSYANSGSSGSY